MLLPSGNPFKCHEEVLFLQPVIRPKSFDMFSACVGINAQKVSMRSDFSLNIASYAHESTEMRDLSKLPAVLNLTL